MLAATSTLHGRLALAMIALTVILGLWGGFQFLTRRAVSGGFRSTFLLLLGLTAVQGLLGLVALVTGGHPRELLHLVYGVFAVVFLPGVYFWASGRGRDAEAAILVASCWIVAIAYARGLATG